MPDAPCVTIGVPVFRGGAFIQEALRSIQNQTHHNFKVIISLDGPQPEAEQLCQPFLRDSRFELVVQPEKLGWVANTNHLMSRVDTPYWYWHPQDDFIEARFLEVLMDQAGRSPDAAIVYSDIVCFGAREARWVQKEVTGDPISRQLALLREHLTAVAFHGLTRVEALRSSGGIHANESGTYAVDTAWVAGAARWGELRRVPGDLYWKRIHADNESEKWWTWSAETRRRAWMAHCADMLEQARLVPAPVPDRHLLWLATLGRLVSPRFAAGFHPTADLAPAEKVALLNDFLDYFQTTRNVDLPAWLETSWDSLRSSSKHGIAWIEAPAVNPDRELLEMQASNAWRAALLLRRIRLRLAPPGSLAARILGRASRWISRILS